MSETRRQQGAARDQHRVSSGGHIEDLAAAYALGALDPVERAAVDRHLGGCRPCAELVAQDTRTVGFLPFAAAPVRPAPDIKAAVFARIAHAERAAREADLPTAKLRQLPPALTIPASRPTAAVPAPLDQAPRERFLAAQPGPRFGWLTAVVTAPLVLALAAIGVWSMQLRSQVATQDAELAGLEATLANFAAGGVTAYQLAPGPAAPQAEGQILISPDQLGGLVMLDLNSPAAQGAYEVWVNRNGKLIRETEVEVDGDGQGQAVFTLDQPFGEYQVVEIKAKPAATGAADAGSPPVVLSGDIGASIGSTGLGDNSSP